MVTWIRLGNWFNRASGAHGAVARRAADWVDDEPAVDEDRPYGCGWFDSSLDLQQGLAVIEHQAIDLCLALEQLFAPEATVH